MLTDVWDGVVKNMLLNVSSITVVVIGVLGTMVDVGMLDGVDVIILAIGLASAELSPFR